MRDFLIKILTIFFLLSSWGICQIPTGSIEGYVSDIQGAVIQDASLAVRNTETGAIRKSKTASDGSFRFDGLDAGSYEIVISAPRFSALRTPIVVRVSEVVSVALRLRVQGSTESVEVKAAPLDRSSNVLSNPISENEIQNTPLANRSFANIAYIAPGTAPVEPSDPTKARVTAVSFAGSSGLNVDLSIDGADDNDDYIGGFLQNYSPEAIREFNVRTTQFDPDTSRTNGGSIVLSTRSGSNDWHASVAGFFRTSAWNVRNKLDNPKPNPKQPFSKQDYVGTLGGPLKRDRMWLFTSYEHNHEDASVAYSALSLTQFEALAQLAASGEIPGVTSIAVPPSISTPFHDNLFNSRLDWRTSERSQWTLRFSLDRNEGLNDLVQQGALPSTGFTTQSNYYSALVRNEFSFSPRWSAATVLDLFLFDHKKVTNSNLGLALAFPFSTTALTTSGFETFGDNQFATAITAFPISREQQKYQFRHDLSHTGAGHNQKFGVNFIHEPVLNGQFADSAEVLAVLPKDPTFYGANPGAFAIDLAATRQDIPASNGRFSQNIQRVGFYAQDSWRLTPHFVLNYGARYDTTFGLFIANGRDQTHNPNLTPLQASGVSFARGTPHDYRGALSPRVGLAYSPGDGNTIIRAGFGMYYNDLAQNGWAQAFQSVNGGENPPAVVIDPRYHSPYAIQASATIERTLTNSWRIAAEYQLQQGSHQYRRYEYVSGISLPAPVRNISLFRTDNRSSYKGTSFLLQKKSDRYELTAHYTLAYASTWGATVGELFDYVNGVTDARRPFGPGDHGPSGEDIRHRFVVSGVFELPFKFQISTLAQFESARPYTMSTPIDINGDGNVNDRVVVNGVQTSLDQFRGSPFSQIDLRVSREFRLREKLSLRPFAEFFNVLNRSNPGNNFIPDISALPNRVNDPKNATAFCLNATCSITRPIRSISELRVPAGALGDFFGPATTVGIPLAMQAGFRLEF
ncbi:MAG: carboxypeptidase regulatory-like domain-containing protein [Acidobacteriota bacterium]|nr:carboxypeptidase regulatory-like domain-containing protein [Acidobacteriota bacterium]